MSLIATTSMSFRAWRSRKTFLPILPKPMSPIRVAIFSFLDPSPTVAVKGVFLAGVVLYVEERRGECWPH